MDSFIESSSRLLEAYPDASVSIKYACMAKKKGAKSKKPDERRASNVVCFKVYDASSTKCLRYSTYKSKELSKLLAFLGPRGVKAPKQKADLDAAPPSNPGVASVMSNVEFVEPEVDEPVVEEKKKDDGKKKKGKKKGRK